MWCRSMIHLYLWEMQVSSKARFNTSPKLWGGRRGRMGIGSSFALHCVPFSPIHHRTIKKTPIAIISRR